MICKFRRRIRITGIIETTKRRRQWSRGRICGPAAESGKGSMRANREILIPRFPALASDRPITRSRESILVTFTVILILKWVNTIIFITRITGSIRRNTFTRPPWWPERLRLLIPTRPQRGSNSRAWIHFIDTTIIISSSSNISTQASESRTTATTASTASLTRRRRRRRLRMLWLCLVHRRWNKHGPVLTTPLPRRAAITIPVTLRPLWRPPPRLLLTTVNMRRQWETRQTATTRLLIVITMAVMAISAMKTEL